MSPTLSGALLLGVGDGPSGGASRNGSTFSAMGSGQPALAPPLVHQLA